jgi:hypothetical protein
MSPKLHLVLAASRFFQRLPPRGAPRNNMGEPDCVVSRMSIQNHALHSDLHHLTIGWHWLHAWPDNSLKFGRRKACQKECR